MPRVDRNLVALIAAGIGAVFFIGPGLWAFFDPQGFYDELATFEPYNEHFIHDIGAFQIGIGVALASAIWRRNDALLAALLGAAVGSIFHTIAHIIYHDLGGKDSDVVVFSVITVVLLAGAALRVQTTRP